MINLTTHELRLIAGRRDIKNYKNMSREKLLSTLDELERNFKNILQIWTWANCKNAESFTRIIRANHKNAEFIAKWTRANRKKEMH